MAETDWQVVEYEQVAGNLQSGVTVLWDAFKTYLTITPLMLGGWIYVIAPASGFTGSLKLLVSLGLCACGIAISLGAMAGVGRALKYQERFLKRAKALEDNIALGKQQLETDRPRLMHEAYKTWNGAKCGSDALTKLVFWVGVAIWVGVGALSFVMTNGKTQPPATVESEIVELRKAVDAWPGRLAKELSAVQASACSAPLRVKVEQMPKLALTAPIAEQAKGTRPGHSAH